MIEDLTPQPAQTPIAAALETVTTNVAEFSKVEAGLSALREKHPVNLVCPVDTPAGMREAIAGRAAWREPRVKLEAMRKAAKAPVLALGKQIDSTAAELEAQLRIGESNYDDQIKAQEKIAADRKAAEAAAEAARLQTLKDRIATHFTSKPARMFGKSAADIQACIQAMTGDVTEGEFFEFAADAKTAQAHALETLRAMHATQEATEAREAEQARIAAEQAAEAKRLADERAAFEAKQADARKEQEEREAMERAAREQREKTERAEREAAEAAQREREESIRAEQKRLDDAKREEADRLAAVERKRLDDVAAHERELQRLADEAERVKAAQIAKEAADKAAAAEKKRIAAAVKEQERLADEAAKLSRIHAAGPELLAALKAMVHKATKQNWNDAYPEELAAAFAAIDLAEGNSR